MENQDTNKSLFDINFDDNVKQDLRGAANWGGIAAIFSITGAALSVVAHFVVRNRIASQYEGFGEYQYQSQQADTLLYSIIALIIYGFMFYFLNRFARLTKTGLEGNNPQLITEGLNNLASYFKVIGVIIIICLSLFFLVVLIGVVGGGA
jgi:small-conductance mechanosensitive channel